LAKNYTKPVVVCDIGETEMALHIRSRFDKLGVPSYFSPEDAARGMVALVKYGCHLKKSGHFEEYLETFFQNR
jgi:acyl-CoA synthetase (NDP forming)